MREHREGERADNQPYHEVLDTIKQRLLIYEQDLADFGLDFDLEEALG